MTAQTLVLAQETWDQMLEVGSGQVELHLIDGGAAGLIARLPRGDARAHIVDFGPDGSGVAVQITDNGSRVLTSVIIGEQQFVVERTRVIGDRITIITDLDDGAAADVFDRQVRAFGAAGQKVLSQLHVGVVGAGGTGSAVCEQLIRLGIGRLTVIDPDSVSSTNLTRIWGSRASDVGSPKVELVARTAAEVGLNTQVTPIGGSIISEDVAGALLGCDVVFGCTDDNLGRSILCRLAYLYLIPVIDVGVKVDPGPDGDVAIDGRISYMAPGHACMVCRGDLDMARMHAEALPPEERGGLVREGYVADLAEPDPAVIAYTTTVAAMGVAELLSRLFGLYSSTAKQLVQFHAGALRPQAGASRPGHFCADPAFVAAGDMPLFLDRSWPS